MKNKRKYKLAQYDAAANAAIKLIKEWSKPQDEVLFPEDTRDNPETFAEIATSVSLKTQLLMDLTGVDEWELESKAPSWAYTLADHLLNRGWKL